MRWGVATEVVVAWLFNGALRSGSIVFFLVFFKVKAKAINMYRTALWLGTYLYHSFVVRFS
jgi:hypothetical protein